MPRTEVVFFKETDGSVPFLTWLAHLQGLAREKCLLRLDRLGELGHELRRPVAENLGAGIYELRAKHNGVNYRMLYFFHGTTAVVVTHGFPKQQAVIPLHEVGLALRRKRAFEADPARHSFKGGR